MITVQNIEDLKLGMDGLKFLLAVQETLDVGTGPSLEALKLVYTQYQILVVHYIAEQIAVDTEKENLGKEFQKFDIYFDKIPGVEGFTREKLLRYTKVRDLAVEKGRENDAREKYFLEQMIIAEKLRS